MGQCIYSNWEGYCQLYDEDYGYVHNIHDTDYGFVGKGACVVEDDEFPDMSCSAYEDSEPEDEEEY